MKSRIIVVNLDSKRTVAMVDGQMYRIGKRVKKRDTSKMDMFLLSTMAWLPVLVATIYNYA